MPSLSHSLASVNGHSNTQDAAYYATNRGTLDAEASHISGGRCNQSCMWVVTQGYNIHLFFKPWTFIWDFQDAYYYMNFANLDVYLGLDVYFFYEFYHPGRLFRTGRLFGISEYVYRPQCLNYRILRNSLYSPKSLVTFLVETFLHGPAA